MHWKIHSGGKCKSWAPHFCIGQRKHKINMNHSMTHDMMSWCTLAQGTLTLSVYDVDMKNLILLDEPRRQNYIVNSFFYSKWILILMALIKYYYAQTVVEKSEQETLHRGCLTSNVTVYQKDFKRYKVKKLK